VELRTGFRNLSYENRLITDAFTYPQGNFIGTREEELASADSVSLWQSSVALVRDTSVFGATSPILGHRFRLEAAPTQGTIDYVGALVDLRQYLMPFRPLTLAGRVMHYGRYGSGGEDVRLSPLFIGYQSLVRGYDTNSFSAAECGSASDLGCPAYDQLLGSRMLVFNAEARFPLFALFGAKNLYGPVPIEVGGFFDAGVAWDSRSEPKLFGGQKELVKSFGATARVNLFGFAVLQVDYAKPIDRPRSAFSQFNLLAGL
jgi:outer membrane protein assembly factor BamA